MVFNIHPKTSGTCKPRYVAYGKLLQRQTVFWDTCGLSSKVKNSGLADVHRGHSALYLVSTFGIVQPTIGSSLLGMRLLLDSQLALRARSPRVSALRGSGVIEAGNATRGQLRSSRHTTKHPQRKVNDTSLPILNFLSDVCFPLPSASPLHFRSGSITSLLATAPYGGL